MAPLETLGFALAGYGCTTCIGNSGPLDEPIAAGDRIERSGRRGRTVRQPQLRGTDPSPCPSQLPRLAAARRRLRPRGPGRHRHADRAARDRAPTASRSISPTSGRRRTRSSRSSANRSTRSSSGGRTRSCSRATSGGRRCRSRRATATTGIRRRRTSPVRRSSRASRPTCRRYATSRERASWRSSVTRSRPTTSPPPGRSRPRRPPASGSRSAASAPLEFNSYGARRGHDEVMVRGTFANIRLRNRLVEGTRGPVHGPPAGRRGAVHLRRRDALPRRGRAAARHRRPRVRLRLVARLGGEGHGAARRPRGHRRELRADPPLQPRRDGRAAAPVPARRERRARSGSPDASRTRSPGSRPG